LEINLWKILRRENEKLDPMTGVWDSMGDRNGLWSSVALIGAQFLPIINGAFQHTPNMFLIQTI